MQIDEAISSKRKIKISYPFGMVMPGRAFSDTAYRYGFNGMEKDDAIKGDGNSYDFGARIYDPRTGRWLSMDPLGTNYPQRSSYGSVNNNPVLRIDIEGKWDITVHAYHDRARFGYGIAILKDRNGKEIARYVVRIEGQHHNRLITDGDTPTGTYKIDNNYTWQTGGSEVSYGPNPRLRLDPSSGEAEESDRDLFRGHGGRQRSTDYKAEPNEPLQTTNGCIRFYDADILAVKDLTDALKEDDPLDVPGNVTVTNDLIKVEKIETVFVLGTRFNVPVSRYIVPGDIELNIPEANQTGMEKIYNLISVIGNAANNVNNDNWDKGIGPGKKTL